MLATTLACLLVLEGALRLARLPHEPLSGWRARRTIALDERNELDYRGHPIRYADDDRVVVLLGDSQVEANTATRFDEMPERLLERALVARCGGRVKVFTVGSQAWGTDQELLALREYLERYRADLVVLWWTPRNDPWNNTFPSAASGQPKPTFWLSGERLEGPSEGILRPAASPSLHLAALLRDHFGPTRDEAWEAILPAPYVPLASWDGPVGDLMELWDTTDRVVAFENLDTEKSHLSMYLTPASPRMRYGLELTRRLIGEVQRTSRAHGADFFLFTTAIENSLRASEPVVVGWHDKLFRVSRAQFDANQAAVMDGFEGAVLPVPVEDWAVGREDKHLNLEALRSVMDELAEALAPRLGAG